MAVSTAIRSKGTVARAVVDISSWFDSESTIEFTAIVDGKNLRRIAGSSDKIDLMLVSDGTLKRTLRLAGQGSVMHIQFNYSGGVATALSVPPSTFKDWRKYAIVGGVDGASGDWIKVVEQLDDQTYDYAQNGGDINVTSTSNSPNAMTGADYIFAPASGDDPISQSDAEQGAFDFWTVAFRSGANVLGSSATPAECFAEPTDADLYYKFDNGDGSTVSTTVTGYGTNATDMTLPAHRTNWLSLGRNDRPSLNSLPTGSYVLHGATVTGGQVIFHDSSNNTADGDDPEWGYDDNRFNLYDDILQVLVRCSDVPAGWFGSGNGNGPFTLAPRDDLGGGGGISMAQVQFGWENGIPAERMFSQKRLGSATIVASPASPAYASDVVTDGDLLFSWEGDGAGGLEINVAFLGDTADTWVNLSSDAAASHADGTGIGALDYRSQSKNRTGSTSLFASTNITAIERFGSENLRIFPENIEDTLIDSVTFSDTINAEFNNQINDTHGETVVFTDALTASFGELVEQSLGDSVVFADASEFTLETSGPDEGVIYSDTLTTEIGLGVELQDSIVYQDLLVVNFSQAPHPHLGEGFAEGVVYTDLLFSEFVNPAPIEDVFFEGMRYADSLVYTFLPSGGSAGSSYIITDYRFTKKGNSHIMRFKAIVRAVGDRPYPIVTASSIYLEIYGKDRVLRSRSKLTVSSKENSIVAGRIDTSVLDVGAKYDAVLVMEWPSTLGSRTEVLGVDSLTIEAVKSFDA